MQHKWTIDQCGMAAMTCCACALTSSAPIPQAATQASFRELLGSLRQQAKSELTILLLGMCPAGACCMSEFNLGEQCVCGCPQAESMCYVCFSHRTLVAVFPLPHRAAGYAGKNGMGKSSTANSLFNEKVANVAAFQSDTAKPSVISRIAHGFTLTVIDTPGLLEADAVSESVGFLFPRSTGCLEGRVEVMAGHNRCCLITAGWRQGWQWCTQAWRRICRHVMFCSG